MKTSTDMQRITPSQPGGLVRQGFGTTEMEIRQASAIAVAEREKGVIQAMFSLAQMHPRDMDVVRQKLLTECKRVGFADAAMWSFQRGGKELSGLSIRFAEAAMRAMGHMYIDVQVTEDAPTHRKVLVVIIDLESLLRFSREVHVEKTVQRKTLRAGQISLRQTTNHYGEVVHIVAASDDEVLQSQQVQVSKAIRTEGLRILPADIKEECEELCKATVKKAVNDDPVTARKKMADAYEKIGVYAEDLAKYLGHPLAKTTPEEVVELRGLYQAISQGNLTWKAALADKLGTNEAETDEKKQKAPPPPSKAGAAAPAQAQQAEPPHDPSTGEVLEDLDAQADALEAEQALEALRQADIKAKQQAAAASSPVPAAAPAVAPEHQVPPPNTAEFGGWLLLQIQAAVDAKDPEALKKCGTHQGNVPKAMRNDVTRAYLAARQKVKK